MIKSRKKKSKIQIEVEEIKKMLEELEKASSIERKLSKFELEALIRERDIYHKITKEWQDSYLIV